MPPKFYEVKIKEIMQKKDVPLIEKTAPIDQVIPFLTTKTHVWVIETSKSKKVVGVITEHDVLSILSKRKGPYTLGIPDMRSLHEGTAEDIMTKRLVKCRLQETIDDVLNKMIKSGIRRLPVTDKKGVILGEVRLWHILKKFVAVAKKEG